MVGLAGLWRACGVQPGVVVGHSQGEIAAAHVAGGLSLEDAARLVVVRSRALVGLMGRGGMVSVALGLGELEGWLERWDGVSVAALNGPSSVVVSGERQALEGLLGELVEGGVRAREIPVGYASHSVQIEEIRGELLAGCEGIRPASGDVPFFSTVTGGLLDMALLDGEYWYRNLRETVRFEGAVRELLGEGFGAFVEVSPHPVLSVGVQETVDEVLPAEGGVVGRPLVVGSLRREQGGLERFLTSLGEAWVRGVDVDWKRVFAGSSAGRVGLPTYAFQRERYWLNSTAGSVGDAGAVGQSATDHPLLSAALALAGGEDWLFTGRLSLDTHPWLADHALMGVVLMPGAALVELALHAGREVGCEQIAELTLQAPLVLPEQGAVQLQLRVGKPDETGRRELSIHSRHEQRSAEALLSEQEWTCHAIGALGDPQPGDVSELTDVFAAGAWPPSDVQAVTISDLYERLAERGYDYGPAFQGLRSLWRGEQGVFAEVALPEEHQQAARGFGLHPALLDAALQAVGASMFDPAAEDGEQRIMLPFSWSGVSLHAAGASRLRVRLERVAEDALSLRAANERGEPIVSVEALMLRPISTEQLAAADSTDSLFHLDWRPVPVAPAEASTSWSVLGAPGAGLHADLAQAGIEAGAHPDIESLKQAIDAGAPVPDVVLVAHGVPGHARLPNGEEPSAPAPEPGGAEGVAGAADTGANDMASAVRLQVLRTLALAQAWLADERFSASRFVLVTRGAMMLPDIPGPAQDLASAPSWGLLRSAQAEHPGRFVLIDLDAEPASLHALAAALVAEEPQMALRGGRVLAPRLARAPVQRLHQHAFDPLGTVLIVGGTGLLGGLLARRLVKTHGASHLLLASRRGPAAEGALELQAELEGHGASVAIVACDACERSQLERLLETVPAEAPLTAVVHAAIALDDGVLEGLTPERVERVLAPKVDAAWHLHELTKDLGLSAFVLFSSAAGTLGNAGQSSYAAANVFLDALAERRCAEGLPGVSLAWGPWVAGEDGDGHLSAADLARLTRAGLGALSYEQGLDLFDAACMSEEALLLPLRLDPAILRTQMRAAGVPALLRGLMRVPAPRVGEGVGESLAQRLAGVPFEDRERVVRELVRAEVAVVLGHPSPQAVDERRAFSDLGFDSLTAVELRNRLSAVVGRHLPSTLIFDYPTPADVAVYLLSEMSEEGAATVLVDGELDSLELTLPGVSGDEAGRARIARRLQALLAQLNDAEPANGKVDVAQKLQSATPDELFDFIDKELQ